MSVVLNLFNPLHVRLNSDFSLNQRNIILRTITVAAVTFYLCSKILPKQIPLFGWRPTPAIDSRILILISTVYWYVIDSYLGMVKMYSDILQSFRCPPTYFKSTDTQEELIQKQQASEPLEEKALKNRIDFVHNEARMKRLLNDQAIYFTAHQVARSVFYDLCQFYKDDPKEKKYYTDCFGELVKSGLSIRYSHLTSRLGLLYCDAVDFMQVLDELKMLPLKESYGEVKELALHDWGSIQSTEMGLILAKHYKINREEHERTPLLQFLEYCVKDIEGQNLDKRGPYVINKINIFLNCDAEPKRSIGSYTFKIPANSKWAAYLNNSLDTSPATAFLKSCIEK